MNIKINNRDCNFEMRLFEDFISKLEKKIKDADPDLKSTEAEISKSIEILKTSSTLDYHLLQKLISWLYS